MYDNPFPSFPGHKSSSKSPTRHIEALLAFAQASGILAQADTNFARNMLLYTFDMTSPGHAFGLPAEPVPETATPILEALCDAAAAKGIIEDFPFERDQFAAHLMNLVTPPPSQIIEKFLAIENQDSICAATSWFYDLCRANDYIRVDQIAKNISMLVDSKYGELEITINLSKPEKDPREIAKLKNMPSAGYPLCMLCIENEGYAGRPGYPSHETLRMIPMALRGSNWYFQYSPYSYYPEHCIVLSEKHVPMVINERTFTLLFDFIDRAPHYFIGSNADLPIVGGSILNHNHFQGGNHVFPMDKAPAYASFTHDDYPGISIEAVRWPMTCIRLCSSNRRALAILSSSILHTWRTYDDPQHDILHETDGEAHNTVTPIARKLEDGRYCMQLVLRNNRTTQEHPLGIFHPHSNLHHIKRENIGLIEVMGLFVLPGRLRSELMRLTGVLTGETDVGSIENDEAMAYHAPWIKALAAQHGTTLSQGEATAVLQKALVAKCVCVLEDAGVYKPTPEGDAGLARFLQAVGINPA